MVENSFLMDWTLTRVRAVQLHWTVVRIFLINPQLDKQKQASLC